MHAVIPALGRLRQENQTFEAIVTYGFQGQPGPHSKAVRGIERWEEGGCALENCTELSHSVGMAML